MTAREPQARSRWQRQVIGPFTLRHLVVLAVVLVATAGLLQLLRTPIEAPKPAAAQEPGSDFYQTGERTTGLAIGQLAPELAGAVQGEVVPLYDLEGDPMSLGALRGDPVWLSFFATWCPPCQEETPVLRDAYATYAEAGLQLVAVSVQETTPEDVADYAATYGLEYDIGFDATGAVFDTYQGFGLPTHVFIDAEGVIRHIRYGPMTREMVAEVVEPLLSTPLPTPLPGEVAAG